jgi:subtilase family serine protease
VLASAGDTGSANVEIDGATLYLTPTVIFPASSPLVTAVGGTSLSADTSGNYQAETVWNDTGVGATGGGVSQYFAEPLYQRFLTKANQTLLKGRRGIPDVAYNADPNTGILVSVGFFPPGSAYNGFWIIGGTSAGAPQWAGLIALANQGRAAAGKAPLGAGLTYGTNEVLYHLALSSGFAPARGGNFFDITSGSNGHPATRGYDLVTGLGSPVANRLIPDLINT